MSAEKNLEWFASLPVERAEELKLDFAFMLDSAIVGQGLARKAIAAKLGTSPAWVTKVLRGDVNLTIETMAKLSEAVGYVLQIEIKPRVESISIPVSNVLAFPTFSRANIGSAKGEAIEIGSERFVSIELEYPHAA